MNWYVIQAFSNCESKVKAALEERIDMSGLSDKFGEIMIPTEQVTELKKGQKKQLERKFFPGYMLVNMEMNDDTWHLVRKTPNVMGFIGGSRNRPHPLSDKEFNKIVNRVDEAVEKPKFKTVPEEELLRIKEQIQINAKKQRKREIKIFSIVSVLIIIAVLGFIKFLL